jgi:hypothetical protein
LILLALYFKVISIRSGDGLLTPNLKFLFPNYKFAFEVLGRQAMLLFLHTQLMVAFLL